MKKFLRIGAILAFLAVALGAFAAHGLEGKLNADQLTTFQTGVRYQFYHALAILITALILKAKPNIWFRRAGWAFLIGIILFSGSIYLLSCRELLGIENWKWLGPITPLGGLAFLTGWLFLIIGTYTKES